VDQSDVVEIQQLLNPYGDAADRVDREAGWRIRERVATGRFLAISFTEGVTFEEEQQ
jgi:hypothetical protein